MRSFIKNILITGVLLSAVFGFAVTAFAAGNMDSVKKYSQFIDVDLDTNLTDDLINWSPVNCGSNCGATVSDDAITGYIWGESVGWINLGPFTNAGPDAGVKNTCNGALSGYAWGENTGWINFEASRATISPNIDIATGEITGQVWAQNYGWIELASAEAGFTGLTTDWRPSKNCDDEPPEGTDPILKVYKKVVGGTAVPGDFMMYIKEGGVNAFPPFPGSSNGNTAIIDTGAAHVYVISEQSSPDYTATFSGDCAPNGIVAFAQGDQDLEKTCTITNTYKLLPTYVCKDSAAINYDPDPNALTKNSLCIYPDNYACKDPAALNYNPNPVLLAKNSLCQYKDDTKKYSCKDPAALNYNPDTAFLEDNGLCNYEKIPLYACKDITATNYDADPKLTADNSLCKYKDYACKDPSALNYNSDTSIHADNTLCKYSTPPPKNPRGLLLGLALLGLASTVPGMVARTGHMLLTFVWGRRKIRGIIYDSQTKEPLDPVYVSVIDLITNQEVKSQQTDMEGRFGFVLPKGHYKIVAGKTNYLFPSVYLAGRVSDEVYDRLYFGEPFTVENEEEVVNMNIPMDPQGVDWNQVEKHKTSFLQYLVKGQTKYAWVFNALFIIGFLASIMITYFYPTWWNYVMTALYVVLGLIQVYGYGPIYAGKVTKNGIPLGGAIVRVWSANLNHEVAKRVTEASGAYYVLVPKADYYVTIDQRNQDGTFTKLFTSAVFHARHGCIDKDFSL